MKQETEKAITWFQVNNIFPIIISLITVAYSFAALRIDIEVIKTNQQNQLIILNEIKSQQSRNLLNINELSNRIAVLESKNER